MKLKCLFLFWICFFGCNVLNAQDLTFHHYGLEDGLSQITVQCILKDSNGFLWLGTQDGLNRFDGTSFTIYKNKKNDSLSISGNFINALVKDQEDNIWIGTNDNGISIYDSNLNSFRRTEIKTGNCSSLTKTSDGNVIATVLQKGIVVFEKQGTSYEVKTIPAINGEQLKFSASFYANDKLYVATLDGRLFVSNTIFSDNTNFKEIALDQAVGSVNTMYVIQNTIWMGTSTGLYAYNSSKAKLSKVPLEKNLDNINIESIDIKANSYYIGSFNGLYIAKNYNEDSFQFKTITTFKGEQNQTNSITSNRVFDTYIDENMLWVGTNNLNVATLNPPVFENVNTRSRTALNNAFILSFAKNKDYLFVGTRKGINCINSNGDVINITKENTNGDLAFNVIRAMTIDHDNNLWIGTIKGVSVMSLNNFDPTNPRIKSIFHNEDATSISSDAIRGIFVDHKGSVWIATYGGGLNRFTGNVSDNTFIFQHYKTNANNNSISSDFVYNMSQDANLNYWITSEDGLNQLSFQEDNYKNPSFVSYFNSKNDTTSISSNTTLHTWHDADGFLWVATQDGFNKFNPKTKTFKNYGKDDGLSNTFVYSITEDLDNDLWLTTNGGIFRFNKATEEFSNYNTIDGVQSSEFNLGAHFYDKTTNTVYAGGVNGLNSFNPKDVSKLDVPGTLKFTSLTIKDKEVNPIRNNDILKQSITKSKEITLNHDDFPCYITFSDLDLRPNKNIEFAYALDNNEWNDLKDTREIQFLSLPKGTHDLKIQGKSRNKFWNTPALQLTINVIPPWYKSNLAYALYAIFIASLFYLFYRLSLQRQIAAQEAKRLKDLDALKSKFITNITHEFRTPLTVILGYADTLKAAFKTTKHEKPIDAIAQNSNDLLNLVNEMLDLAKVEQGKLQLNPTNTDMVSFLNYMVSSFSSFAASNNVNISYQHDIESLPMDFDIEKMRQIMSNLLSNAIKFSKDKGNVVLALKTSNTNAVISVTDDGIGISEQELPMIFDRFYRSETSTKKYAGSGIGLALTKELVALMNGKINVESKEHSGSTFTLELPITNTAPSTSENFTRKTPIKNALKIEDVILSKQHNTLLIVEDNPEISSYIKSCLQEHYNLLFAENGKIGLQMAEDNIPDLIISDVMMPEMDGFEMVEQLQSTKITNHIPVIMLTAKVMQEDKLTGLKSGADAYLTKPFQKAELLLRIETLIEKRKQLQAHYRTEKVIRLEQTEVSTDKNLEFLDIVVQHITKNLDNANYNAIALAQDMGMSESQLYRKLKALTDKSSAIFIRSVRLEKAKALLQTTSLSVSEIAYATGFSNPNWFGKIFKETFNTTPSEFRK